MELLKSLNLFEKLKCKILKLAKIFKIEIQNAKFSENLKKREEAKAKLSERVKLECTTH